MPLPCLNSRILRFFFQFLTVEMLQGLSFLSVFIFSVFTSSLSNFHQALWFFHWVMTKPHKGQTPALSVWPHTCISMCMYLVETWCSLQKGSRFSFRIPQLQHSRFIPTSVDDNSCHLGVLLMPTLSLNLQLKKISGDSIFKVHSK